MPQPSESPKSFLKQFSEDLAKLSSGVKGAFIGFVLGVLLVIFGFWKTVFILILTVVGYMLGLRIVLQYGSIRELLDKFIPPGFFR